MQKFTSMEKKFLKKKKIVSFLKKKIHYIEWPLHM